MATVNYADAQLIGIYREPKTYVCKVDNVGGTAAVAINGDWAQLPEEETSEVKAEVNRITKKNVADKVTFDKSKVNQYIYSSKSLQRDASSIAMIDSFVNADCVLLMKGHNFEDLSSPVQEWVAMFGTMIHSDEALTHESGAPGIMFVSKYNRQEIIIPTDVETPDADMDGTITIAAGAMIQRDEI